MPGKGEQEGQGSQCTATPALFPTAPKVLVPISGHSERRGVAGFKAEYPGVWQSGDSRGPGSALAPRARYLRLSGDRTRWHSFTQCAKESCESARDPPRNLLSRTLLLNSRDTGEGGTPGRSWTKDRERATENRLTARNDQIRCVTCVAQDSGCRLSLVLSSRARKQTIASDARVAGHTLGDHGVGMPDRSKGKRTNSAGGSQGDRQSSTRVVERKRARTDGHENTGDERRTRAEEAQDVVEMLTAKFGTAAEALRVLSGENVDYRRKNRELRDELADLEEIVPHDGELVLSVDDAKVWTAIKSLKGPDGKDVDPAKVPDRLKRADELETELVGTKRKEISDKAARTLKFNADVLRGLVEDPRHPLTLELRDMVVRENGKDITVPIPYVRKANDDKSAWEKLSDFADREWKSWLPALKTVPTTQGGSGAATNGDGSAMNGASSTMGGESEHFTPLVDQAGSSHGGGTGSTVDRYLQTHNAAQAQRGASNPLRPKAVPPAK